MIIRRGRRPPSAIRQIEELCPQLALENVRIVRYWPSVASFCLSCSVYYLPKHHKGGLFVKPLPYKLTAYLHAIRDSHLFLVHSNR